MRVLADMANRFRQDEDGAAMVEYTVLLAIITATTIGVIILVAGWVTGTWQGLYDTLTDTPGGSGSGSV